MSKFSNAGYKQVLLLEILWSARDLVCCRHGRRVKASLLLTLQLGIDLSQVLVGGSVEVLVDAGATDCNALLGGQLAPESLALSLHLCTHSGLLLVIVEKTDPHFSSLRTTLATTLREFRGDGSRELECITGTVFAVVEPVVEFLKQYIADCQTLFSIHGLRHETYLAACLNRLTELLSLLNGKRPFPFAEELSALRPLHEPIMIESLHPIAKATASSSIISASSALIEPALLVRSCPSFWGHLVTQRLVLREGQVGGGHTFTERREESEQSACTLGEKTG